jgi:hypothetical protein
MAGNFQIKDIVPPEPVHVLSALYEQRQVRVKSGPSRAMAMIPASSLLEYAG